MMMRLRQDQLDQKSGASGASGSSVRKQFAVHLPPPLLLRCSAPPSMCRTGAVKIREGFRAPSKGLQFSRSLNACICVYVHMYLV